MKNPSHETLTVWTEESGRDKRNTRWAVIVAVVLHALFFRLELPETAAAERTPQKPVVFPIQAARFQPPTPREQRLIPERRARRVPVPDPTPDDPEPFVEPAEAAPAIDLPDTDLVFGIPATPPPVRPVGPLEVGGDVLPPMRLHSPPPRYPEIARKARIQGTVIVEAVINSSGKVNQVTLVKGLPLGLGEAAVEAVRGWRFRPATLNGKPVSVIYRLEVHFRLM